MALEKDPLGRLAVAYWSTTLLTDITAAEVEMWLSSASVAGDIYDESDNLEPEYADITTRKKAAGGFTARKPVIRDGELSFDFSWEVNNVSDLFVQALIDAANSTTPLAFVSLDYAFNDPGRVSGDIVQGPAGNWYPSFTKANAIRDAQRGSATLTAASFAWWYKSTPTP